MKLKGLSVLLAFITLAFTLLFSSWLFLEIIVLVLVLSFAGRGVIWPKDNVPESPLWFGLFWGLINWYLRLSNMATDWFNSAFAKAFRSGVLTT